jgi:hypothetical protein
MPMDSGVSLTCVAGTIEGVTTGVAAGAIGLACGALGAIGLGVGLATTGLVVGGFRAGAGLATGFGVATGLGAGFAIEGLLTATAFLALLTGAGTTDPSSSSMRSGHLKARSALA